MVLAMSSCNVSSNKCAISPTSAGASVFKESCNASSAGAAAISPRLADSSAESGTCTIEESCNARAGRPLRGNMAGMAGAPGLHASDVRGVTEVPAVHGSGQPGGLAGGLARASAVGRRAIPLTLTVAMVGIEK